MLSKRDVLAQLSREELVSVVERFGLEVADRRKRDDLLEAVAASKKATLAEVLPELSRERLKALCVGFGLDESGREKAILIERLTGTGAPKPSPAVKPKAAATSTDLAPDEKLTREKLEGYLWSAADILRGSIDSSDYKNYILGLLFLKRLSDRFEEECEALQGNRNANPEDPDEHDFFVPKKARWRELQKTATNLGEALNKACSALEDANPKTLESLVPLRHPSRSWHALKMVLFSIPRFWKACSRASTTTTSASWATIATVTTSCLAWFSISRA
jgi:type I restriction enzyme M protein